MTRIVAAAAAVLAATAVLAPARVADAHRPPPGRALEYRTELAGHGGEVMVGPRTPRAGPRARGGGGGGARGRRGPRRAAPLAAPARPGRPRRGGGAPRPRPPPRARG